MRAERIGTACAVAALSLAGFLVVRILEIDPDSAALAWVAAAPVLLYAVLGPLVGAAQRAGFAEGEASAAASHALVRDEVRAGVRQPISTIIEACDRLVERAERGDVEVSRVRQEADDVRQQALAVLRAMGQAEARRADGRALRPGLDEFGRPLVARRGHVADPLASLAKRACAGVR